MNGNAACDFKKKKNWNGFWSIPSPSARVKGVKNMSLPDLHYGNESHCDDNHPYYGTANKHYDELNDTYGKSQSDKEWERFAML